MMQEDVRTPTQYEKQLIERLLSLSFDGRDSLLQELPIRKVRTLDDEGSILLRVDSDPAEQTTVPVEGIYDDEKNPVSFLLHVAKGKLYMLEVVPYRELPTEVIPIEQIQVNTN